MKHNLAFFRRKRRIRSKIVGSASRPRVSVFLSNCNMYLQVIDDEKSQTIASVSTYGKKNSYSGTPTEIGAQLGKALGEKLSEQKIEKIVFDRGGHPYHGVVQSIAESLRGAGLAF